MRIDEAYAKLNIVQDYIPKGSSNRPGAALAPRRITIHNTDNTSPGANAAAHAKYQKGADARARKVSWHFTVDDHSLFQSLPINEIGWHAGSSAGNSTSLGIEICMNPEMDVPTAYDRAALLTAVLAFQHEIPVPDGIVQHHHWTGKQCPRVLRDKPKGWDEFVQQVADYATALREVTATDLGEVGTHHHGENLGLVSANTFVVIASDGLNLRGGPGVKFGIRANLPFGTAVTPLSTKGVWTMVDVNGDGGADGFVHSAFLSAN